MARAPIPRSSTPIPPGIVVLSPDQLLYASPMPRPSSPRSLSSSDLHSSTTVGLETARRKLPCRKQTMALRLETATVGVPSLVSRFQSLKPCGERSSVVVSLNRRQHSTTAAGRLVVRAAKEVDVDVKGDILPSGEWPENFSMLNYEDLSKHYEPDLFKPEAQPDKILAEVMSKIMHIAFPDQSLSEVDHHFAEISGLPVVDETYRCLGVLSRKDRSKASDLTAKVKDVMSSPAITLSADKTVSDAAVLMLKNKVHRIPVVNDQQQVVGIVTRTDIFTALEGGA